MDKDTYTYTYTYVFRNAYSKNGYFLNFFFTEPDIIEGSDIQMVASIFVLLYIQDASS